MRKLAWSALSAVIILFTGSSVFAQPNIDGSDWTGYFRTTGLNNQQSITATVYQTGGSVEIITSKSGLGHHFIGSINTSGHMLVYDQYDGEDWTTHYGPATSSEIALYDYICPTCSQLNVIYLTRPPSPPPPPPPPPPPIPYPPATVSASQGLYIDRVVVSWSHSSDANGYQVYRCFSQGTESCARIATLSASPYTDWDVVAGQFFYYRVTACNNGNCSGFSEYSKGYLKVLSLAPIYELLFE